MKLNGLKMSFKAEVSINLFDNICHKVCICPVHSLYSDVEYIDCKCN